MSPRVSRPIIFVKSMEKVELIDMKIWHGIMSNQLRWAITVLFCYLFIVLFAQNCFAQIQKESVQEQDIQLVWSANHGQGEQVFFSTYTDNQWTIPVQISNSSDFVFKPVSSVGNDGKIWVLWTQNTEKGNFLQFTVRNSKWSEVQQIYTGMDNNRAVTVIVDANSTPWIAWTGTEESYSDVFWSRWNGQGWSKPVKAHADNNVPDVHPVLAINDSGHIVLSWQTYANEKYVTLSQYWDDRQWQQIPQGLDVTIEIKKICSSKELPPVPDFIKEPHKATFFVKTTDGAVSIPLSQL